MRTVRSLGCASAQVAHLRKCIGQLTRNPKGDQYFRPMSSWQPLIDGALAEAARSALRDIAVQIGQHSKQPEDLVLFWAYASNELDTTVSYPAAVDRLLESVDERDGALQLHGGLAGIGWTLAHVGDPDDCEEFLATLDATLVGALTGPGWAGSCDLIVGLTGLAVYFLERLSGDRDVPVARAGLERVVQELRARATAQPPGLTWHTDPALLPDWQRAQAPNGYYNCGVAHGVPGTISVLARAAAYIPSCRDLIDGAMRWLDVQRVPETGGFTTWIIPGRTPTRTRSAWCYGDPGVATATWAAAARIGAPIEPWRTLALACARGEAAGIVDASLCHGAFGLAHLFNRCFQASGDLEFRNAARSWIERGLAMRRPGEGVGGFLAHMKKDANPWVVTDAFLEGAAGIGLVLLAALGDTEPNWDRLLACDLPFERLGDSRAAGR